MSPPWKGDYPLPWPILPALTWALLSGQQRSFAADARRSLKALSSPPKVIGVPASERCLLVVNHYARPGFQAWWIGLTLSAVVPAEVHWVVTSAWRYPDLWRRITITPLSRWVLRRLAHIYGFTLMPPMPPHPQEAAQRAMAVRRLLRYVQAHPQALIGLAPEGGDFAPPGQVAELPCGVGRLVLHLTEWGLRVQAVGLFEENGLCLRFGLPFTLPPPPQRSADERDAWVRQRLRQEMLAVLA